MSSWAEGNPVATARDTASVDAFRRHGLYYPFFHVRDDQWLKVSALYWPRIARLVPEMYPTRDSRTVRAFSAADSDLLYRVSPGDSVVEVGARFAKALEACGRELAGRFPNPSLWLEGAGGVHITHISDALVEQLVRMGLALRPDPLMMRMLGYPIPPWELKGHRPVPPLEGLLRLEGEGLPRLRGLSKRLPLFEELPFESELGEAVVRLLWNDWVAMPAELVVVYNSMLVEAVATANQLQPTTDQLAAFTVVNDWSDDRIAAALLGRPGLQSSASGSGLAQILAFLAIKMVVPADLDQIPAEKILEIRERYGAEFQAFGLTVDQAATDLAQLADVRDPAVIERYLNDEVVSRFIRPTEDLRRQLSGLKLDAATMTINVKTELPAAAGLIGGATLAGHPLVAGASAVALGLLAIRRGIRRQRDSALKASPAASYLLHLDENLEAHRLVREATHAFQRIAGTDPG
jgi:hypothetical protein